MTDKPAETEARAHEVSIPFLFVPHGEDPSAEWISQHPRFVRISATFIPLGDDGTSP